MHSANDGVISQIVNVHRSTGAIVANNITKATGVGLTAQPYAVLMGSDGTYAAGLTWAYNPVIDQLVSWNPGSMTTKLENMFLMYRKYRVKKMVMTFLPQNAPRDVYSRNETATGASLNNMYPSYGGPDAYFACTRFTGPALDLQGAAGMTYANNEYPTLMSWNGYDEAYKSGFKKSMKHVSDMKLRRKPIRFSFRPTVCSQVHAQGALRVTDMDAVGSTFQLPDGATATTSLLTQMAKMRKMPWLPTFIPNAAANAFEMNTRHTLFGMGGAFRADSWLPNSCPQWRCNVSYVFEFRGRRMENDAIRVNNTFATVQGYPLRLPVQNMT